MNPTEITFCLFMLFILAVPFIPGIFELIRPKDSLPLDINQDEAPFPRKNSLSLNLPDNMTVDMTIESQATKNQLVLKEGVTVKKWVDAGKELFIEKGCNIGTSASAGEFIKIQSNCTFKQLYAPTILCVGDIKKNATNDSSLDISKHFWFSNKKKMCIPPNSLIKNDLQIEQDLYISRGSEIDGSIKCRGQVFIEEGVIINGSIFATGSIIIANHCQIRDNIFSQRDVSIYSHSVIGIKGKIKSVIGKKRVSLAGGVIIHGQVFTDGKGLTL